MSSSLIRSKAMQLSDDEHNGSSGPPALRGHRLKWNPLHCPYSGGLQSKPFAASAIFS
jgi:hypothetical protein